MTLQNHTDKVQIINVNPENKNNLIEKAIKSLRTQLIINTLLNMIFPVISMLLILISIYLLISYLTDANNSAIFFLFLPASMIHNTAFQYAKSENLTNIANNQTYIDALKTIENGILYITYDEKNCISIDTENVSDCMSEKETNDE